MSELKHITLLVMSLFAIVGICALYDGYLHKKSIYINDHYHICSMYNPGKPESTLLLVPKTPIDNQTQEKDTKWANLHRNSTLHSKPYTKPYIEAVNLFITLITTWTFIAIITIFAAECRNAMPPHPTCRTAR
jgi:hypothetical protein